MNKFNKQILFKYLIMAIALLFAAISYNLFLRNTKVVAGGINGIGIIGEEIIGIDASIVIFVVSFILILLSYLFLDKKNTIAGLFAMIYYPIVVKLTSFFMDFIDLDNTNILFLIIIAGIINGITNGFIFRTELNNGGIGILSKIVINRFHVSIALSNFIINMIIVFIGMFIFSFINGVYALIYLWISAIFCKMILNNN